ncbi:MAG: DUF6599 family protein [bacterium]
MSLETLIGVFILLLLCVITVGVYLRQFKFDEELYKATLAQSGGVEYGAAVQESEGDDVARLEIAGLQSLGVPETFDEETLSQKIDGRAELYLGCGFEKLTTARYALADDPGAWFEIFVFDMGVPRNAFAVYSLQRRSEATDAAFAQFSYAAENALFFVCGRFYVEIVGAQTTPALMETMTAAGKAFVAQRSEEEIAFLEVSLFPQEFLQKEQIRFVPADGFGYEKFNDVFVGPYELPSGRLEAFVSVRNSSEEASQLAQAYLDFLIRLGSEKIGVASGEIADLKAVDLLGDTELVFTAGKVVAGIHAATDRAAALELAEKLYREIQRAAK